MVASGVPKRNGIQHAAEIADMALDLMNSISQLKIPHRNNESLRLRIGLNSGN